MNEAITVAVITAVATVLAQIIMAYRTQEEVKKGQEVFNALTEEKFKTINKRLDAVDEKLKEHNEYAQKFNANTVRLESLEKSIEEVKNKL